MRVLPVTNSGPTTHSIESLAVLANGAPSLQVIQAVKYFARYIFLMRQLRKELFLKLRFR